MSTGARPNEAEPAGLPLHRHGQRTAAPAGRPFTFTTRAQTSIQFGFRHTNVYTSLWISKACDRAILRSGVAREDMENMENMVLYHFG